MDNRKGGLEATLGPIAERTALRHGAGGLTAEAFDDLVRAHQRRIYRILLVLVRDTDAAETLTQECFLRAYAKGGDFRGEASVGTWLVRIALNLARDHAKSRRVAFWRLLMRDDRRRDPTAIAARLPDSEPPLVRTLIARDRLAAVWAKVDRLRAGSGPAFSCDSSRRCRWR